MGNPGVTHTRALNESLSACNVAGVSCFISGEYAMAKINAKVSNFLGRDNKLVPWLIVDDGFPGTTKGKAGPGLNPKLIVALLELENRDELLAIAKRAIAEASPTR